MAAPLVDISSWISESGEQERAAVVQAFARDLCETGFIRICGHGVPPQLLEHVLEASKSFFRQPLEVKRLAYSQDRARRGYSDFQCENYASLMGEMEPNDSVEKYRVGRTVDAEESQDEYYKAKEARTHFTANNWPESGDQFREAIEEYYQCMERLANTLLSILEAALRLEPGCLCCHMQKHTSILTLNHFPEEQLRGEVGTRIAAHTDVSMITIVAQDGKDGLQMKSIKDDSWTGVPAEQGCLVVNIGDCLMDWTAGKAVSTVHRVAHSVNTSSAPPEEMSVSSERLSIAYFVTPEYDAPMDRLLLDGVTKGLTYSKWRKLRIKRAMQARRGVE